jgi:hypothetical protein
VSDLNFETADFGGTSQEGKACRVCQSPLNVYYEVNGGALCETCHASIPTGKSISNFFRALGYGFGAAVLGAVAYATFINLTGISIGIVSIFLGYLIGRAVRIGSGHVGGKRYQAIAMILTYAAMCSQYLPTALALTKGPVPWTAYPFIYLVLLAFPVLEFSILGLFIMGIGIYQAWKMNKPVQAIIRGPFRAGEVI